MKPIFLETLKKLKNELPESKWNDLQKGQMQEEKPPVIFPATLVNIQKPRTYNLNKAIQHCDVVVTLSLCFSFTGERTATAFNEAEIEKSLEYMDMGNRIFAIFQGWETEHFEEWERVSETESFQRPGYKQLDISFKTTFKQVKS